MGITNIVLKLHAPKSTIEGGAWKKALSDFW